MTRHLDLAGQGEYVTIFYLDDDQDDLDSFCDVMGEIDEKALIKTHTDSDSLMEALHNPPPTPHILFLDLNMPGRNGIDVLREIRATGTFDHLPVVILSTSTSEHNIYQCRQLGANMYIPKASDYLAFKASIDHALKVDWTSFEPGKDDFLYTI